MTTARVATLLTVLFAFLCILQVSRIAHTLDTTRSQLSSRSTGAINSLTQIDRNLDQLMDALVEYRTTGISAGDKPIVDSYQTKFEVVWGSVTVFSLKSPGTLTDMPAATAAHSLATDYLQRNDAKINSASALSEREAAELYSETKIVSDRFHDVGHDYFLQLSMFSDELKDRTSRLYKTFLIYALLVVACGGVSLFTLFEANRKSNDLVEESRITQARLTQVVDELRSGKLENKAKDSFLAAVSHDLRQPLHALGLFLGALEEHVKPTGYLIMDKAKQSKTALNKLLSSLLDLSRLDAGAVKVSNRSFNIGTLLGTLEHGFQSTARLRNMELNFDKRDQYVHTDPVLIDRVLRNLIENALTHSGGSRLEVSSYQRDGMLVLTVADDGIGVPVNQQDDIFSEYFQIGNPERDRSKGLGIGLSIVKRLCELLDLDLQLVSEKLSGARFAIPIPLATNVSAPQAEATEPAGPHGQTFDMLIAVIEDEQGVREGMEVMLNSKGYRTVTADSAKELLGKMEVTRELPDVLICDYRLRGGSKGDEAIKLIQRSVDCYIPAVIITGDTSPQRVKELTISGFQLLHKPVEPATLVQVIQELTEQSPAAAL